MAEGSDGAARANQKLRTRKDLLEAAALLMQQGRRPSLEEIAEAALVSRATAYRYFPNADTLLLEASFHVVIPGPDDLFGEGTSGDGLVDRLDRVDAALHDVTVANEAALRMMLSQSILRAIGDENDGTPVRQDRRTPLIRAAISGARETLDPAAVDLLAKATALLVGPEAVVASLDVLRVDEAEARRIKRWAIRALVEAAVRSSRHGGGRTAPQPTS